MPEWWKQISTATKSKKIYLINEAGEIKGDFCLSCKSYSTVDNFSRDKMGISSICKRCTKEYGRE